MAFFIPLLSATQTTLSLALLSLLCGLVLAISLTTLQLSRWQITRGLGTGLVLLLRGLPEILILLFVYFVPTQLLFLFTGRYISFSAFGCGVVGLSLIFAAYASQTLYGALKALPEGQYEVATTLGLARCTIFYRIVLPQAWRYALPGLGNQWLILLKDTALVSLIGVTDLMRQTQIAAMATGEKFTYFGLAALIYLVITLISQRLLKSLTRWATRFERESASC